MGRREYLAVGINDFPGTGSDLRGCVNDAFDVTAALVDRGYKHGTTLVDSHATKAAVVDVFHRWVRDLRSGDRAVVHLSTHGSYIPDRDGDEADRRDEVVCLHDFQNGGLLSDDEIHGLYSSMRAGVRLTIFGDLCHSGTVNRFVARSPAQQDRIPRFLSPAFFLDPDELRAVETARRRDVRSRPGTVLISGCADHEFSYDAWFGGRPNGAFTRALLDSLAAPGQRQTAKGLHNKIRSVLPSVQYPQTPQLQASLYQRYSQLL